MRRFFIFLFISFASLFFSQCEIGKISFALEDVLTFFKVEWKYKKNKIQKIDKFEFGADEMPENKIQMVYTMTVLNEPRQENVVQNTKELIILKQEKPENIIALIDKIGIKADEKPENEIQQIDEIELKAKENGQNILQNIQEISILAQQRYKNENGGNESIKLLEKEKPQIEPKENGDFCFSGVARPQNEIENKDEILIEEKKKEDLQIVTVDNLLFSKKEQQKNRNGIYNGDNFKILCTEKKNQNTIETKENFQIRGKESAEVIELRKKADEMYKALQEYEKRHNEVLKVIKEDGMGEIPQNKDPEEAIFEIIKRVKEKAKENMIKEGKITENDILDTNRIEEIMKANNDFKSEMEKTKKKFSGFKENLKNFGEELSKFGTEHKKVIDENKVLRDELAKIKAASNKGVDLKRDVKNGINSQGQKEENGNNEPETPSFKNNKLKKHQESEIILSQDNTQKKNSRHKFGYSRDIISIHEPNEIKEERQSMWSSISRNLFRSSSYSPCKNNRISFPPFFDVEKFYTDQREKKIEISKIDDISQRGSYLFLGGNGLNKKVRNVSIDIKECHETSLQFQNKNAGLILNNVDENETRQKLGESENKIFKKIDIKGKKDNKIKTRKSYGGITAGNISKDAIVRNNRTTVIGFKGKDIKEGVRNFKFNKFDVAGKKLGTSTSFNTFNKSNTSLSNSGMYGNKMEDKNIINNSFEQKKIKNNLGIPRRNEKKDIKRLSFFGGVKKNQLKEKKETTKSRLPQKNNDEAMRKIYAKIRDFKKQGKTSGAHTENQKIQQQKINILKENNAGMKAAKKDFNKEEMKMLRIKTSTNLREKKEKSVIGKNSENSNNNSNSVREQRLKEKKMTGLKRGDKRENNLQEDKKVPTKPSLLNRLKRNENKKKE